MDESGAGMLGNGALGVGSCRFLEGAAQGPFLKRSRLGEADLEWVTCPHSLR
jgi:hypothetical protein